MTKENKKSMEYQAEIDQVTQYIVEKDEATGNYTWNYETYSDKESLFADLISSVESPEGLDNDSNEFIKDEVNGFLEWVDFDITDKDIDKYRLSR